MDLFGQNWRTLWIRESTRVPGSSFYSRAKRVLELALDETRRLGHNYVGTEHILLGILREGEGIGAQILQRLGLDLEMVRAKLYEILSENPDEVEVCPKPVSLLKKVALRCLMNSADLTRLAIENKLDPVIGRKGNRAGGADFKPSYQNTRSSWRTRVGKTAIVEGLAQK